MSHSRYPCTVLCFLNVYNFVQKKTKFLTCRVFSPESRKWYSELQKYTWGIRYLFLCSKVSSRILSVFTPWTLSSSSLSVTVFTWRHTQAHTDTNTHTGTDVCVQGRRRKKRGEDRETERDRWGLKPVLWKKNYIFHLPALFSFFSKAYFCRYEAEYQGKIKPEKYWAGQKVRSVNE